MSAEEIIWTARRAFIHEDRCIGCTLCIRACPVDAIQGKLKQAHTVMTQDCTGCELCLAPCPVDCIDMLVVDEDLTETEISLRKNRAQQRFILRQQRLAPAQEDKQLKQSRQQREKLIQMLLKRAREKRTRALTTPFHAPLK